MVFCVTAVYKNSFSVFGIMFFFSASGLKRITGSLKGNTREYKKYNFDIYTHDVHKILPRKPVFLGNIS